VPPASNVFRHFSRGLANFSHSRYIWSLSERNLEVGRKESEGRSQEAKAFGREHKYDVELTASRLEWKRINH
jgi:hypothetical protein